MLNATRTVQTLQLSLRVWGQKSNIPTTNRSTLDVRLAFLLPTSCHPHPNSTASSLPKHGFHLGVANAGVFDSILRSDAMEKGCTLFCASSIQSDLGSNQVHLQLKNCNPPAKGIPPTTSGQIVAINQFNLPSPEKKNMSISGHQSAFISINPH